jgi:curved DNA-binding protein CbpA
MTTASSAAVYDIPFQWMPVAALLGMISMVTVLRVFVWFRSTIQKTNAYMSSSKQQQQKRQRMKNETTTTMHDMIPWMIAGMISALGYSFLVAKIERSYRYQEYHSFDPHSILGIPQSANTTEIQQTYRQLLQIHHPDQHKNDPKNEYERHKTLFYQLSKAYDALTNPTAKKNYEIYGHPDGPLVTPTLAFTLPKWLFYPEPPVAHIMLFLYTGAIVASMGFFIQYLRQRARNKQFSHDGTASSSSSLLSEKKNLLLTPSNSVSVQDLEYLANQLTPQSSHMDILLAVISAPENVEWSCQDVERVQETRNKRLQKQQQQQKQEQHKQQKNHTQKDANAVFEDLLNQDGWDDGNDDDDDNKDNQEGEKEPSSTTISKQALAAKAEKEKQAELERLRQATGKADVLLEGMDDGVLGQEWVERTLQKAGHWPWKDLRIIKDKTFPYEGKPYAPLDHPGLRRTLLMMTGRLHSVMLNSHTELLEAGAKNLIDQTYFKASMEFRQRVGLVLEAALRISAITKSARLLSTILETVAIFKIGCLPESVPWFNGVMTRQYGILPRLKILSQTIGTPDHPDIATGDTPEIEIDLERIHAERFLQQKLAMFEKQGIPPQVGLATYREGWWFILTHKRLDGKLEPPEPMDLANTPVLKEIKLDPRQLEILNALPAEERFLTAWPMLVTNCAQKGGKVKIQFPAPKIPGTYQYHLAIKSLDFLGADQEIVFDNVTIVDATQRKPPSEAAKKEQ